MRSPAMALPSVNSETEAETDTNMIGRKSGQPCHLLPCAGFWAWFSLARPMLLCRVVSRPCTEAEIERHT